MADLVQDRPPHLFHQALQGVSGVLVRALVKCHALGHTFAGAESSCTFVQAHQSLGRAFFDDEDRVLEVRLELIRDRVHGRLRGSLELRHAHTHI